MVSARVPRPERLVAAIVSRYAFAEAYTAVPRHTTEWFASADNDEQNTAKQRQWRRQAARRSAAPSVFVVMRSSKSAAQEAETSPAPNALARCRKPESDACSAGAIATEDATSALPATSEACTRNVQGDDTSARSCASSPWPSRGTRPLRDVSTTPEAPRATSSAAARSPSPESTREQ